MFKLWYLLSKEVDLVAMFVLFDLQNSSFLSFSSCEVDNFIYYSLWWLLGGCCHLYVEWSLCCLMIRFNIAFQSRYCSLTVKSLWFSRFCSVWFDSTHVRSLSLLAFTFFMFYVEKYLQCLLVVIELISQHFMMRLSWYLWWIVVITMVNFRNCFCYHTP